ncbi:MAG: aminotransferase class I/II-fold pyridoxal phosphate-dependent enzyme [Bacteroidota bacterium]
MIPLHEPYLSPDAWDMLKACLDSGWVSSAGPWVSEFEEALSDLTGSPHVVAVNSGTAALHLALSVAGVRSSDGVIIPDITFVATANAVRYLEAQPLLAEVNPDTYLLDVSSLEIYLETHTEIREAGCWDKRLEIYIRAVVAVHVMGNVADMQALKILCHKHHLILIEDAAEALGSSDQGKQAGTWGDLGVLSFNGNKILTTGGGGVVLTANEQWARQIGHLATQAKVDPLTYDHDRVGFNYRMTSLSAALGLSQLRVWEEIKEKKEQVFQRYEAALKDLCTFQRVRPEVKTNRWLVTATFEKPTLQMIQRLHKADIQVRPIWKPMHMLPMYLDCPKLGTLHHSRYLHTNSMSLPSSAGLKKKDQERVISAILANQK